MTIDSMLGIEPEDLPPNKLLIEAKIILTYLAVGVLHQNREIERGSAGPAPLIDPFLQMGWDKLAQFCYRQKAMPPRHLPQLARWLHQSPATWPEIGPIFQAAELDSALLYTGAPTQACNELGSEMHLAHNPERELGDLAFKHILNYCHTHVKPDQYTRARKFLVEHPYLPQGTVAISANVELDREIRQWLSEAYEPVPQVCLRKLDNQLRLTLCPRCGWPLQWRGDQAACYSDLCAKIVKGFHDPDIWQPYIPEAAQTKRAEQSSIVGPERPLLELYQRLTDSFNVQIDLWPQLDTCDLSVRFPHGPVWVIDLKDYESPKQLALNLRPFTTALPWDRAFYLFPDHRNRAGYLLAFRQIWAREKHVDALFVKDFITRIERELDNA